MRTETNKPCLALMGEFSAGKSTLANLLIGSNPLPVRIIATQLPPVKISFGTEAAYRVTTEGERAGIDLDHLDKLDIATTRYLQLFSTEDFLEHCDLLDMPGISDPNMSSSVWENMINEAHGVIWCSQAVQAWRQSEAAVWAEMPPSFHANSLLLLTQIDKVNSTADRERILRRVRRETIGLFRDVLPISLLAATIDDEDRNRWEQSGAGALIENLVTLLNDLNAGRMHADHAMIPALKAPDEIPLEPEPSRRRIIPRRPTGLRHDSV